MANKYKYAINKQDLEADITEAHVLQLHVCDGGYYRELIRLIPPEYIISNYHLFDTELAALEFKLAEAKKQTVKLLEQLDPSGSSAQICYWILNLKKNIEATKQIISDII